MNKIDGTTKVLGLIGDPVSGSLSPKFQNWTIERLGLDYCYVPFPVRSGGVTEALGGARELGIKGLNVTAPHKEKAANQMDELSPAAEMTGAVNTVIFEDDGRLIGDNTDWRGFIESLRQRGFSPSNKSCLVFGAGGGAAGVLFGLIREGADKVVVVNRTLRKAEELVAKMGGISPGVDLESCRLSGPGLEEKISAAELIVNATSVGMGDTRGRSVLEDEACLQSGQVVFDLIYNPHPTELLEQAARSGAIPMGGLDMLILQGLKSLEIWTGAEIDTRKILPEIRDFLKQIRG